MDSDEGFGREEDAEMTEAEAQARLDEALSRVISSMEKKAMERVGARREVEQRWLMDMRQYHGIHEDREQEKRNAQAGRSTLFVNMTRPKTDAMVARLFDLLFPTDDRNWGISPTPVPELSGEAAKAAQTMIEAAEEASRALVEQEKAQIQQAPPEQQQEISARKTAADKAKIDAERKQAEIRAILEAAKRPAQAMEREIEDQLEECRYSSIARDAIEDACQIGTGILKGPVVSSRGRARWAQSETGEYVLARHDQQLGFPKPETVRVDPWAFYPDMTARNIGESEGVFERHLLTAQEMRKLAERPGFSKDAIRQALRSAPKTHIGSAEQDLRNITNSVVTGTPERYDVWEYHGPLDHDDIATIAIAMGADDLVEELEEDPLISDSVILWFCDGKPLFFERSPMDSGESIYYVYNLSRDPGCVFGYGVPYMMRDGQAALGAAWRMMMDNSGLSTGPQIVINPTVIEPADGSADYTLRPRKTWFRKTDNTNVPAFEVYNINSNQGDLAGIIALARDFLDEESGIPLIAQGEEGAQVQNRTLGGMAMLMNSANTMFRRVVKNWDDDVTTRMIRAYYDWNMQFSDKQSIKGDYEVKARGTSVLLVREIQSQNLMVLAERMTGHPILGDLIKPEVVARMLVRSMMLDPAEVVRSDEEVKQIQASRQQAPDPDVIRAESMLQAAQIKAETDIQVAQMNYDREMMSLAQRHNMELDKLKGLMSRAEIDANNKERLIAAEIGAARQGIKGSGGGYT